MNIIELEVEFVVTTLGRLVDDGDRAVVVVAEADLHLGGTFHGEADSPGDARLLAVDRQLIVDVHLSGGDIRPGDLDLLRQLPVGGLVAADVALEGRADDLPLLVLDVNLVHAAGFGRVGDVHAAVLVRVEVDVRLCGAWWKKVGMIFKGLKEFKLGSLNSGVYLPSKATVRPETGLPEVKTLNLFSMPAMPLIRPLPWAEMLIVDCWFWIDLQRKRMMKRWGKVGLVGTRR